MQSIEMGTKASIELVGRKFNVEELIVSQNVQFSGCLRKVISQNNFFFAILLNSLSFELLSYPSSKFVRNH